MQRKLKRHGTNREEVRKMWQRLEENHPVLYEVIQWGILAIASTALVIDIIVLISKLNQ